MEIVSVNENRSQQVVAKSIKSLLKRTSPKFNTVLVRVKIIIFRHYTNFHEYQEELHVIINLVLNDSSEVRVRLALATWKKDHLETRHFRKNKMQYFQCFNFKAVPLLAPYEPRNTDFEWPKCQNRQAFTPCDAKPCVLSTIKKNIVACMGYHKHQCENLLHRFCAMKTLDFIEVIQGLHSM